MDSRFIPRTNEEMLAAVRAFQERQRKWFEESDQRWKIQTMVLSSWKRPIQTLT